jgi:integrase
MDARLPYATSRGVRQALASGVEPIVARPPHHVPAKISRRLETIARQHHCGLLIVGGWPGAGADLTVSDPRWYGADGAAGLPTVLLHDLRHGCASVLLQLAVPPRTVMEILGHSALEMTMNPYACVSLDDKRSVLDKIGAVMADES